MKQKLTIDQESCVIYRIRCKNCGKFYIGETSWCLCDRSKSHQNDIKYMNNQPGNSKKTALVKHVFDTGPAHHEFDFLGKKGMLKIHQANQIILHGNTALNFKSDAAHVSPVFYNIIKRNSKRPNVNPPQPISYSINSPNVLTPVDIPPVNNISDRNTRTKYNLRSVRNR